MVVINMGVYLLYYTTRYTVSQYPAGGGVIGGLAGWGPGQGRVSPWYIKEICGY